MPHWGNMITSEMLDAGFFRKPPLSSRAFVHVALVLGLQLVCSAVLIAVEWRRMPGSMSLWVGGACFWSLCLWLRALRDHRKLLTLFEHGGAGTVVPGSALDEALRVAANTMYFGLFSTFGISAAFAFSLGVALSLH